ncbi:MAG: sigma-70 family RNA polymerase sigma factor [Clostridia bacterium]|nr:sigma-70 family RNA polymerase sigma factor [Clostridia bacterium]
MHPISLEPYTERVYAYALRRTFSQEEAEELSQDILLTVLQELPRLKDESRLEPFLWGIAHRVTLRFRRTMGKRRRQMSWDDLSAMPAQEDDTPGEYAALRRQVAMLSAQWRDILVLHYFDGLSTRETAARLSLPEGTVTWRLSQARKRLKEESYPMNETALHPVQLYIGWSGSDCGPDRLLAITSALSQNLLWLCRETPQTVEALAAHTGVPAYYIEDALRELMQRDAISEIGRGRYRSEVAVYTPEHAAYFSKQVSLFTPLAEDFAVALRQLANGAKALGHHTAGRAENDLIWLYGIMAMVHLEQTWNPITPPPHPLRFDGGRWTYHGYVAQPGLKYHYSLNCMCSHNLGSRGTYSHTVYRFGGFAQRDMLCDTQINLLEDVLHGQPVDDPVTAAQTIEGGYLHREEDGTLLVTPAAMTLPQYRQFCRLAEDAFAPFMPRYQAALRQFAAGCMQLFPPHLSDAGRRLCAYVFRSAFADPLREAIISRSLLPAPTKGQYCDVLVQFK